MATQLEISTVAAVKSIQTLRQQTSALTIVLKDLSRTMTTLQTKMSRGAGTQKLAAGQKKAAGNARLLSREMLKQKNAIASTRQQFLNLTQSLKMAGAEAVRISNLRRSFTALEKKLKSGKLTANQYVTAMNKFKASMGTARREVKRLTDEQTKANRAARTAATSTRRVGRRVKTLGGTIGKQTPKVNKLGKVLRNVGSSAIFAVGPLSGIGARVTAFTAISGRAGIKIAATVIAIVGLGVAVFKLGKAMIKTAIEVNKIMNALRVATGSTAGANREFQFLVETSRELALDLSTVGVQYAQLAAAAKGTRLAGEGVQRIFAATAKAALVLGLSTEQTTGAMRALQQMISKGTVQAEELRGQLGERIPGAFQLAARAMDMTTRALGKMMEQGLLVATELFPLLAEEMERTFDPSTLTALESMTAAVNSLKTEWFLFLDLLEKKTHVVTFLAGVVRGMKDELRAANEAMSGGAAFNKAMKSLTDESERLTTRLSQVKSGLLAISTTALAGRGSIKEYKRVISDLEGKLVDVQKRIKALQRTNVTGPSMDVFRPAMTNQEFLDLPVASVDRYKDSIVGLRKVLQQLSNTSIPLKERLDLRDSLNRTASAVKAVNKVMRGLDDEMRMALRIQFAGEGPLPSLKQLRDIILSLIIEEKNLQNAAKDATAELKRQARAANRLQLRFDRLVSNMKASSEAMTEMFAGDVLGAQFAISLGKARRLLLKFSDDTIADFARVNNIISQFQFDLFKESEGIEKAQAFADILQIVEERLAGVVQTTKDAKDMVRIFQETRTEAEKFNTEMARLEQLLILYQDFPEAVEAIKRKMLEINPVLSTISDGIKQMGSELVSGIAQGKNLVDVLTKSFASLLEQILQVIVQMMIIGPLLQGLGLPGGSAAPTKLLGLPTNILGFPSRKGNIFQGGKAVPFRQGGVVNSPSNFGFNGGIGSIAEDGPEGILPLKRGPSGRLGVEASGGGAPTVNFFLAPGTNLREFNEAQPQIAAMLAGTFAAAQASNG